MTALTRIKKGIFGGGLTSSVSRIQLATSCLFSQSNNRHDDARRVGEAVVTES
jgi:hypothetical protein